MPPARPGPWTDDGLTHTTSTPVSRPASNTARSPSVLERSYVDRYQPRCGVSSRPTTPDASPIVAAEEVWTNRRTPARAAARTTTGGPSTLVRQHRPGIGDAQRVDAGHVVDHRAPRHRRGERVLVEQLAAHGAAPSPRSVSSDGRERASADHLVARGHEPLDERATDDAAAARDEDAAHVSLRSAEEKLMK